MRQPLLQRLPQIAAGQRLPILQQPRQIAVGGTVAVALQHQQAARRALAADVTGQQRAEILPLALAVADLDQIAFDALRLARRRHARFRQLAARNALLLVQLADHRHRPGAVLIQLELINRARPEIAHPLSGQQQQNADQRQQADGHRTGGQPYPRRPALHPVLHGAS